MKFARKAVGFAVLLAGVAALWGCSPSPTEPKLASADSQAQQLELIEVIARPAGEVTGAFTRPTHPADSVEIAMRTRGTTKGADLSIRMIALADGSTVGTQKVRLNAGNSAAPMLTFAPNPQWSTGRYLFEVMLDGKLAGSQELEIFPAEVAAPTQ